MTMELVPTRIEHEGRTYEGLIAAPSGEVPAPGVLVFPSAAGVHHQAPDVARRLADAGYVAIACDMYPLGTDTGNHEAVMAAYNAAVADRLALRRLCGAWLSDLKGRADVDPARTAAVGYCFGGTCVLELVRDGAGLKAASSFHGGLQTTHRAKSGNFGGDIMIWHGMVDPFINDQDVAELRAEMDAAALRYQLMQFSGVSHSFTDPAADTFGMEGLAYDAVADAVSWAGTMALFDQVLR